MRWVSEQRPGAGRRQRGVALIMVLLAMALIVMMATGMIRQQNLRIYKASHAMAQNQGFAIALGSEDFAKSMLRRDYDQDKEDNSFVDDTSEFWFTNSAILPLDEESGLVEVQIEDMSGRFNLNDLVDSQSGAVDEVAKKRFDKLLQILGVTDFRTDAIIDWIDENDQTTSAYGAEDGAYLVEDPPYRAANQPFMSVSELRLLQGMTEETYQALLPFITALPVSGAGINVNTAPKELIESMTDDMTSSQAEKLVAKRDEEPYEEVADFLAEDELAGSGISAKGVMVRSRFFEVLSRITYDNRTVNLSSLIYRSFDGSMKTVNRDRGETILITKPPFNVTEQEG